MGLTEKLYAASPVWMQHALVSAYGWQWKQRRFGGLYTEAYQQARQRESFTIAQWQQYQQQQLSRMLLHAYDQVPYYNKSFKARGLNRQAIANITPGNIQALPVLQKENLRQQGTTGLLAQTREKSGSFFASSGSTGTPTQVLFSHAMHQRWMALFESRVRNWAGVTSAMPRGMIGGRRVLPDADHTPPFYRYNVFEKQVYFSAYHISEKNAARYLEGIQKYKPDYMTGYAMSNFLLARFFKDAGLQAPPLKAVITSSEKLTPGMRQTFLDVYGCKTYDGWSGVEACGLITECEEGSLHISPDAGLLEVLDANMQPVAAGVEGTVYCTGFLNYDQPLIRYNIGDTIILSGKTCSCGRQMPVVQEILGRVEDVIVGRDGRQMVRFHSVFNGLPTIQQAQVIQETASRIRVLLVADNHNQPEAEQSIRKRIISQLGDMDISIAYVAAIPLNSNGKYQAVVSKIKKTEQKID